MSKKKALPEPIKAMPDALIKDMRDNNRARLDKQRLKYLAKYLQHGPEMLKPKDWAEIVAVLHAVNSDDEIREKTMDLVHGRTRKAKGKGRPTKALRDYHIALHYLILRAQNQKAVVAKMLIVEEWKQPIDIVEKAIKQYREVAKSHLFPIDSAIRRIEMYREKGK